MGVSVTEKPAPSFVVPLHYCEMGQLCLEAWLCQPCLISRHQAALEGRDGMDWGVCLRASLSLPFAISTLSSQRQEIRTRFQIGAEPTSFCGGDTCVVLNNTACSLIQHHKELESRGLAPLGVFGSAQTGYVGAV
eukprot:TRINITY_DN763_c6_g2_i1.p1 TRINITY_DN763_c6_g2~~TRINITY_DN763_c6_g2_i1.p1  ORF type:complete len:135 (+),score=14.77 TRINITY_DN763_c6_g2_i1:65-469(+)